MRNLSACILTFSLTLPAAGQLATVGEVESIGNPIRQVYGGNWQQKREVGDLQAFDGRLYVAHGTTNTNILNRVIVYDPAANAFHTERDAADNEVRLDAEVIRWARVFGDVLYFANYDSISSSTQHFRRIDGQWVGTDMGRDHHARDFYNFGGNLFTYSGFVGSPRPHVMVSTNDGASWRNISQPGLPDNVSPGWVFGEFRGEFFAFPASGQVLRYRPDTIDFEVAFDSRNDWLAGTVNTQFFLTKAEAFDDRLLVISGGEAWSVSSMIPGESAANPRLTIPPEVRAVDFAQGGGLVYLLGNRPVTVGGVAMQRHVVYGSADGVTFEELTSFRDDGSTSRATAIEYLDGHLYVGRDGGDMFRFAVTPIPEPASSAALLLGGSILLRRQR